VTRSSAGNYRLSCSPQGAQDRYGHADTGSLDRQPVVTGKSAPESDSGLHADSALLIARDLRGLTAHILA